MTNLKTNFKARIILKEDLSTEEVAFIESKISNLAEKYDMHRHVDGITYSKREPYKGLDDLHAGIAFCVSLNTKEYRNYFSAIYSYSYFEGVRYNAITRNPDENYFDYINRVKENPIARTVKIADLTDNLSRKGASHSLRERYCKALQILGADIETTVVMSPEEFYEKMKYSFNEDILSSAFCDLEDAHRGADALMCNILESLGYGEGIKVFKAAEKWYS